MRRPHHRSQQPFPSSLTTSTIQALTEILHLHTNCHTHISTHFVSPAVTMMQPIEDLERQIRARERQTRGQQKGQIKKQRWAIIALTLLTTRPPGLDNLPGRHPRPPPAALPRAHALLGPGEPPRRAAGAARGPPLDRPRRRRRRPRPCCGYEDLCALLPRRQQHKRRHPCALPSRPVGGRMLDGLDHGYMPLMQEALSVSPPGVAGEVRDYYHAALRSVFRCGGGGGGGGSMELARLSLLLLVSPAMLLSRARVLSVTRAGAMATSSTSASASA